MQFSSSFFFPRTQGRAPKGHRRLARRFAFAALFGLVTLAQAASQAAAPAVAVRLVGPSTAAGHRYVGIVFDIAPGWHVYWDNPGDSGQAPEVRWQTPKSGFGPLLWPVPQRLPTPPLSSYGYRGHVMLPVRLSMPEPAALQADIRWLACAATCVPGHAVASWQAGQDRPGDAAALATAVDQLPKPLPAGSQAAACLQEGRGVIALTDVALGPLTGGRFFPGAGTAVDENVKQVLGQDGGRVTVSFAATPRAGETVVRLTGVVCLQDAVQSHAYQIDLPLQAARLPAATPQATAEGLRPAVATAAPAKAQPPLWQVLLLAFAGGMLLNFMPCVFPILSMKAMALVQTSGAERRARQQHAWLYACGNFLTFTGLGIALLTLRYFGHQVGWGFQMQSPAFVAGLVLLMFSVGMAQMGWLRVGGSLMGLGQSYAEGRGHAAAFFTGVLAVVVATPCSAPFMGVATGAALMATAPTAVGIFAAMGLGLGLPYVALCHMQTAQRLLPRPGPWMQHLRQATGLALWGTTTWLMWILGQQRGLTAVLGAQLGCLALGAGTWAWHTWPASRSARATGALLAVLGLAITFAASENGVAQRSTQKTRWRPYSAAGLAALRHAGQPVFVDFTAAWCVTCQLNAKLILDTAAVEAAFLDHDVARLRADWTDEDPEVSAALASFGRSGVPLYVLYPADPTAPPVVLPGLLTAGSIYAALAHQPAPQ